MDASGSFGFRAIFQNHWLMGKWPKQLVDLPITFKEIFPIVLAFEIWGGGILNKQSSKDQYKMCLVRRFVLSCMRFNILTRLTRCVHIEGRFNTSILPDLVSRFKVEEFHQLAPQISSNHKHRNHPWN